VSGLFWLFTSDIAIKSRFEPTSPAKLWQRGDQRTKQGDNKKRVGAPLNAVELKRNFRIFSEPNTGRNTRTFLVGRLRPRGAW
jgi:hypothetical protein